MSKLALESTKAAAVELDLQLDIYSVFDTKGLEAAIDTIHTSPVDAFVLNPDFLDMVSYASSSGLITSTSTNAHFLDEENETATTKKWQPILA